MSGDVALILFAVVIALLLFAIAHEILIFDC